MTVKEVVEILNKVVDQEMPIYFDCPNCGKCNELYLIGHAVVAHTRGVQRTESKLK